MGELTQDDSKLSDSLSSVEYDGPSDETYVPDKELPTVDAMVENVKSLPPTEKKKNQRDMDSCASKIIRLI